MALVQDEYNNKSTSSYMEYRCMFTDEFSVVTIVTAVFTFLMTVFGNSLILLSLYKYPTRFKGGLYIFIGNLAATDLYLGFTMLLLLAEHVFPDLNKNWDFCLWKAILLPSSYICSNITLMAISVDRFMAVMFPFVHLVKSKRKHMFYSVCVVIWLVGAISIVLIYLDIERPTSVVCRVGIILSSHLNLASVSALLFQLIVSAVLYAIVVWKMKTSLTKLTESQRRTNQTESESQRRLKTKSSRKTFIMILVFILFGLCWLPFIIVTFITETSPAISPTMLCVREYTTRFGFFNSTLNWIVYGVSNKKFQEAFKKLLTPSR